MLFLKTRGPQDGNADFMRLSFLLLTTLYIGLLIRLITKRSEWWRYLITIVLGLFIIVFYSMMANYVPNQEEIFRYGTMFILLHLIGPLHRLLYKNPRHE